MFDRYELGTSVPIDLMLVRLLCADEVLTPPLREVPLTDREFIFAAFCNVEVVEDWASTLLAEGYDSPQVRELASATHLDRERANRLFQAVMSSLGLTDLTDRVLDLEWSLATSFLTARLDASTLVATGCLLEEWVRELLPAEDLLHHWRAFEVESNKDSSHHSDQIADRVEAELRAVLEKNRADSPRWKKARIATRLRNANSLVDRILDLSNGDEGSAKTNSRWARTLKQFGYRHAALDRLEGEWNSPTGQLADQLCRTVACEFNLAHIGSSPLGGETYDELLVARFHRGQIDAETTIDAGLRLARYVKHTSEPPRYYWRAIQSRFENMAASVNADDENQRDSPFDRLSRILASGEF